MTTMARQASTRGKPRVLYTDPVNIVGMFHDLQIALARGAVSAEFLRVAGRMVKDEAAKIPTGMGMIIVVNAEAEAPDEAARAQLQKMHTELYGKLRGIVRVIEGEGFAAAAKRSVLTIIDLATRHGHPSKVVSSVDAAVTWILPYMEPVDRRRYSAGDVVTAIEALRVELAKVPS
jgi:hypothetical protein